MQSSSKGEGVLADAGHEVDAAPAKPNCGWFLVRRWCEKSKRYIPMQVALTLCHVSRGEEAVYSYPFSHGFGSWMTSAPTRKVDGVTIPAPRSAAQCIEQVRRLYQEQGRKMPAQPRKGGGGSVCLLRRGHCMRLARGTRVWAAAAQFAVVG